MKLLKPAEGIAKKQKKKMLQQNLDSPEVLEGPKVIPMAIDLEIEEPVVTKPATVEPVAAKPVVAKPVTVEPVAAKPVVAKPVTVEPVAAKPVVAKPVTVEPVAAKPVVAKPVAVEPVAVEPLVVEPVTIEPVAIEPVAVEPVSVEPLAIEQVVIEPEAVEPVAIEPVVVEPVAVEPVAVGPVAVEPADIESLTLVEPGPATEPSGSTTTQSAETTYSILDTLPIPTDDDSSDEYDVASDWNNDDDDGVDIWEQNQWQYDRFFNEQNFADLKKKKMQEGVKVVKTPGVKAPTKDVAVGPSEPMRQLNQYTITTQTMKLLLKEMDPITENYKAERIRIEQELKESMSQPIVFDCEKAHELAKIKKKNLALRHEKVALTLQKRFTIFLSALEAADATISGFI